MFFVFTGPESSGKTTFANFAFSVFGGGLVPEYARQYLERQQGRYTFGDLKIMAENQYEFEEEQKLKYPYVWCDTDLITLFIWSLEKFNRVNPIIKRHLESKKESKRFYFLCRPDIPWEYDALRENPEDRDRLFELYLAFLEKIKVPYIVLQGSKEKKENTISEIFTRYLEGAL
ncbi:MAG: ATP-binding protein [Saprospiraceae bacterium]|nr:ATP-binding protein [Saprospiraceae bacterium]MBK6565699.1 ATP-binding protein [Saprospiraceae bacterium]MBK6784657.1 ATP-binding protein [Saprospiraceae bacterium]MBK7525269.1 ATP-binding protein [Saprospiraceae bacterium]MBK8370288.1 ATP-binding protein [Saprospiraceae bacterium]